MLSASARNPLAAIPCFADLDVSTSRAAAEALREVAYGRDEIILLEGERCPGLFVIKSGSVKLYRSSPEGEEHIVRVLGPGGCFECAPLFDRGPNPVSAQAMEDSVLFLLPASAFDNIMLNPEVSLRFARVLSLRLRALLNQVEDMSFRPVGARLARLLLQMAEPEGEVLAVTQSRLINQQHLACMLGCTRQIVNASLSKLARQGLIRRVDRRIVVLKPGELRRMVGEG